MRYSIILVLVLIFASCAMLNKSMVINLRPKTTSELIQNPFDTDETIDAFRKFMPPKTHIQKLIKRSESHQVPDTIYSFNYKKSKVAFYKTRFNQEFLFIGSILNPEIELRNGIRVGMDKSQFFTSLSDIEYHSGDTIKIQDEGFSKKLTFFFDQNERLIKYTFTAE